MAKKILIDLDWFLDMRLAMYDLYDNPNGIIRFTDGDWFTRESDIIIRQDLKLDEDHYRKAYFDNYTYLMKNSLATSFIYGLIARMNTIMDMNKPGDKNDLFELHITTPFSNEPITDDDRRIIVDTLKEFLNGYFEDIVVYNYRAETLTPEFVYRNGYSEYYCYHWSEWLKLHQDNLSELVSPSVTYYFPELKHLGEYNYDIKKNKQKYDAIVGDGDLFGLVSLMMAGIINIHWIDVIEVCVNIPPDNQ